MNIFLLDKNITKCAQYHCDQHVVKMILESVQMLCTTHHVLGGNAPYKKCHINHPCTKWALDSIHNAYWLIKHGMNLADEYHLRYGKQHSCYNTLLEAYYLFPKGKITNVTPFARAMPDEYKLDTSIDTFTAYKMYIASKPWVASNYLRMPERKPEWI